MAKLNQILAVEKTTKNRVENEFTKIYQNLQKAELLNGLSRTYSPLEENGETFPPEQKKVQFKATDQLAKLKRELVELFDVTAVKDVTNCNAKSDVTLEDGTVIAKDVPATYLLFLEKKLVDLATLIKKLPTLDQGENWTFSEALGLFQSSPVDSIRTKKIEEFPVLVPPTKEHPAQVGRVVKDVTVGTWKTTKYSGALQTDQVEAMAERVEALQKAVKFARAQANTVQTTETLKPGKAVLNYIFGL